MTDTTDATAEDTVDVETLTDVLTLTDVVQFVSPYVDMPEHGGSLSYGDFRPGDSGLADDDRRIYLLPYCGGSDYSGSLVERSNYLVIREDYADHVIDIYGGHGSYGLAVRHDAAIPEVLADIVRGLTDYPLVDEDAHSQLEMSEITDNWESWAADDTRRTMQEAVKSDPRADILPRDRYDEIAGLDDVPAPSLEIMWTFYSDAGEYPYDEGMGNGNIVFPNIDTLARTLADRFVTDTLADWEAYARGLSSTTLHN